MKDVGRRRFVRAVEDFCGPGFWNRCGYKNGKMCETKILPVGDSYGCVHSLIRRGLFMAATVIRNAFVYGSLLAPEVLTVLLQRVPRSSHAVVHGYHRYSIKGRIYPAVLLNEGDRVLGKVLFDLSEQELCILDSFEDTEYTKLIVWPLILKAHDNDGEVTDSVPNIGAQGTNGANTLEQVSNGLVLRNDQPKNVALGNNSIEISPGKLVGLGLATEVTAYMYVWAKQGDPDLFGDWDYELWRVNHLQTCLKTDSGSMGIGVVQCHDFKATFYVFGFTTWQFIT